MLPRSSRLRRQNLALSGFTGSPRHSLSSGNDSFTPTVRTPEPISLWVVSRLALVMLVISFGIAITGPIFDADPVMAQTSTTLPIGPDGAGSILGPKPGQGVAPNDSGDRGGAAQIALFFVLVGAMGAGVTLIRRDMKRTKRRAELRPDDQ